MSAEASSTDLLDELRNGRREALDQLIVVLYDELREIAHRHRVARDGPARSPRPRSCTRRISSSSISPAHDGTTARIFSRSLRSPCATSSPIARRRASRSNAAARSARHVRRAMIASDDQPEALLQIDDALDRLAKIDARLARVVECRFFGGLTNEEICRSPRHHGSDGRA